jgi:hypothetical protein
MNDDPNPDLEELRRELGSLPAAVEPPEALWTRIRGGIAEERISRARSGPRWWQLAAAAVLVFGGGYLAGRRAPVQQQAPAGVPLRGTAAAADIQRSGTDYVVALAAFRQLAGKDPRSVEQAREAALATFDGASKELAAITPEDPTARSIRRAVVSPFSPAESSDGLSF